MTGACRVHSLAFAAVALTFANPIDLAYRMQPDCAFREGADPEVVLHDGRYWLFASKCGGYYVSDDLVRWQLVKTDDLPLEEWAPTVVEIGGRLHFSARDGGVFRAVDAVTGKWEKLDVPQIPSCDSALFLDDDGRLYDYWGAGPRKGGLVVQQFDPVSFRPIGQKVATLELDLARYGWDVRGRNNEEFKSGGYPEGSQMVKRDGRYYFQYATPGTEHPSYCDVALVGTSPLGPFVRQKLNPFSSKPDGYARGSGHGKTFRDKVGNWWHVTTCVLGGCNRRISLMPVFFDADGEMWCDTAFADWPLVVPDRRAESPEAYHAGWMPLAYGKPARVSSGTSKGTTDVLTDEDIGTFWSASSKTTNEFAEVSFGGVADLRAVQIGFADQPVAAWRQSGVRRGYRVEATSDGKVWQVLFEGQEADFEHPYRALATPVTATAIRVVPTELPEGASFALREIRAFGRMEKPLPAAPQNVKVVRDEADRRHATVTWDVVPGATGYVVKFGPSSGKQHLARLVRGKTTLDLRMLDAEAEYVWSVIAFNEAGFTDLTDVAAFDSRIAANRTSVETDDLEWIDGVDLPMESKGYEKTITPYGRLPVGMDDLIPQGVRAMQGHATGHYFILSTDSPFVVFNWMLSGKVARDPFIPPQGLFGVDIYRHTEDGWRFVQNGRLRAEEGKEETMRVGLPGSGMRGVLIYLPTRGCVLCSRLGVRKGARVERWRHKSGIQKPVVHYGTSIVHGGCASRPGLCFTSQAGRLADVPYVNLGFSGCARLEIGMADVVARADASLYIVDPVWNCDEKIVAERCEPFLRRLHELRPETPILLCEGIEPSGTRHPVNIALEKVYRRLSAGGSSLAARLHYLPAKGLIPTDGESTHDYCHPNDYGSMTMGRMFAKEIRRILGL